MILLRLWLLLLYIQNWPKTASANEMEPRMEQVPGVLKPPPLFRRNKQDVSVHIKNNEPISMDSSKNKQTKFSDSPRRKQAFSSDFSGNDQQNFPDNDVANGPKFLDSPRRKQALPPDSPRNEQENFLENHRKEHPKSPISFRRKQAKSLDFRKNNQPNFPDNPNNNLPKFSDSSKRKQALSLDFPEDNQQKFPDSPGKSQLYFSDSPGYDEPKFKYSLENDRELSPDLPVSRPPKFPDFPRENVRSSANFLHNVHDKPFLAESLEKRPHLAFKGQRHRARVLDVHHPQVGVEQVGRHHLKQEPEVEDGLPDLEPDAEELEYSLRIDHVPISTLKCPMEKGCLSASATTSGESRRLMRFSSVARNVGSGNYRPPVIRKEWEFHTCRNHQNAVPAFMVYTLYNNSSLEPVVLGHETSFCVEDSICDRDKTARFECGGEQGISPGCADVFDFSIDCQWIDVSDVNYGDYIFVLAINPDKLVREESYENNALVCDLAYHSYREYAFSNCNVRGLDDLYET